MPLSLDSLVNALSGLGGSGDSGSAARPSTGYSPLTWIELRSLYRQSGIARRIVDIYAVEATRRGWRLDGLTAGQQKQIDTLHRALHLYDTMRNGLTLARREGGCAVLVVLDDQPRERWDQPARPGSRVLALHALEPEEAVADSYDTNPSSPRFRGVSVWNVQPYAPGGVFFGTRVHASRILWLDGEPVDVQYRHSRGGYGDSALESAWQAVREYISVRQGGATLLQKLSVPVLKIAGLAGRQTSEQSEAFSTRMKLLAAGKSLVNMILLADGEELTNVPASVTGFDDLSEGARSALCAETGIPATVLFGEAPGGLSTDDKSAKENWTAARSAYQERVLRPALEQFYTLVLGDVGWELTFEPLDVPTSRELAEERELNARADQLDIASGILDPDHIRKSRYSGSTYGSQILPVGGDEDEEAFAAAVARELRGASGDGP